jgi:hypothetical protein
MESLTRWRIRSNIQTHGLLWAVRHETARNLRAGCCPERAFALAMASCTGRYFASTT